MRLFAAGQSRCPKCAPDHLYELVILDVVGRIQTNVESAAVREPCQQIVARAGPELLAQRLSQSARIVPIHVGNIPPALVRF